LSEEIKGEIEIVYNDDDVVKQSKQTSNAISSMGKSIDSTMSEIEKSTEDAGDEFSKTGDKSTRAFGKVERASDGASQSVKDTALEVVALGESFSSVAESIFAFEEKLLSLERSQFGVTDTALGLKQEIQDFKLAIDEGIISIIEQERALQSISKGYQDLDLQQRELSAQAQALNGEFISFGLTLIQTAGITGIMLKQLGLFNKTLVINRLSMIASSTVFKSMIFNVNQFRVAMIGATFSLGGFRTGIRATMAALGPIGIIMIAVGAAFAIWETNAFGVQEKLTELFETIKQFLPFLQVLEDVVKSIFPPEVANDIDNVGISLDEIDAKVSGLSSGFNNLSGNIVDFSGNLDNAESVNMAFATSMSKSNKELTNQNRILTTNTQKLNENTIAAEQNLKKNELSARQFISAGGTLNTLVTAGDTPTRRGNVSQEFFDALSPELRSGFRPVGRVSIPSSVRERLSRQNEYSKSLASVAAIAIAGKGVIGRTQANKLKRNPDFIRSIDIILVAAGRGLINRAQPAAEINAAGLSEGPSAAMRVITRWIGIATNLVDEDDIRKDALRAQSFDIVLRSIGIAAGDVGEAGRTRENLAILVAQNTQLTQEEAFTRLGPTGSRGTSILQFKKIIDARTQLANELAFQKRTGMIQFLP